MALVGAVLAGEVVGRAPARVGRFAAFVADPPQERAARGRSLEHDGVGLKLAKHGDDVGSALVGGEDAAVEPDFEEGPVVGPELAKLLHDDGVVALLLFRVARAHLAGVVDVVEVCVGGGAGVEAGSQPVARAGREEVGDDVALAVAPGGGGDAVVVGAGGPEREARAVLRYEDGVLGAGGLRGLDPLVGVEGGGIEDVRRRCVAPLVAEAIGGLENGHIEVDDDADFAVGPLEVRGGGDGERMVVHIGFPFRPVASTGPVRESHAVHFDAVAVAQEERLFALAVGVDGSVGEAYVADGGFGASDDHAGLAGADAEVGETEIGEAAKRDAFFDVDANARAEGGVDGQVGEENVVDVGVAGGASGQVAQGVLEEDAVVAADDGQVAEGGVADGAVVGAADADALAPTVEDAVGDGDVFARHGFVEYAVDGAQDDAVVAGLEDGVADGHVAARVDVDAVVVDHALVGVNFDTVDGDAVALHEPEGPAGRFDEGGLLDAHVGAAEHHEHAGAMVVGFGEEGVRFGAFGRGVVEREPRAVDGAWAGDGDVFGVYGADQGLRCLFGRAFLAESRRVEIEVVVGVRAADEAASDAEVELDVALEGDGAGEPAPARADDPPSAGFVAGVDGLLDRGGVEGLAVALCAVIENAEIGLHDVPPVGLAFA